MVPARLEAIKRAIIAPRSQAIQVAVMCGGVIAATALRLLLLRETQIVPFITFFPVILVSALLLDARWAIGTALLSLAAVNFVVVPAAWALDETSVKVLLLSFYGLTICLIVAGGQLLRAILIENEAHLAETEAFNAELQHRTKNVLQIMRALVARGPRDGDAQAYYEGLGGRIDALAKANDLLRYGALATCGVEELVESALAPFDRERFHLEGPPAQVSRAATTPLMMALHELCTNATKYGALSNDHGTVNLRWKAEPGEVVLEWAESGGPAVTQPTHRGLGTRLLVPHGGLRQVRLDWRESGLVCRMIANHGDVAAPSQGGQR